MLENLIVSFEMMGIGLIVVLVSLLLLAIILIGFSKVFYKEDKKKQEAATAPKTTQKNVLDNKAQQVVPPEAADPPGQTKGVSVKPEIVAATMGALLFSLEARQQNSFIKRSNRPDDSAANIWLQTGRARVLHLRQDFALLKRGKNR